MAREMANGKAGNIEVICGGMFSGKTDKLIERIQRVRYAKKRTQVFKQSLDNRFSDHHIVAHNGQKLAAVAVKCADEIIQHLKPDVDVIGIDEAQFFDDALPRVVDELANSGIRVILAGLDTDFRGEPFGPMGVLMAYAEDVEKLHAVCMVCGENASRTQRLVDGQPAHYDSPIILIGAAEAYEARCRKHHIVPRE